tara:strand:+ start:134 stop:337 length:204 start_codon:yes stop_codon:yes gene_type:complete
MLIKSLPPWLGILAGQALRRKPDFGPVRFHVSARANGLAGRRDFVACLGALGPATGFLMNRQRMETP